MQTPRSRSILLHQASYGSGRACGPKRFDPGVIDRIASVPGAVTSQSHFDWRRLAVSSSVFSHNTPASGVFRTSSTELERKTDPDDEGIVVPNQAAIGFPAAEPHEGRIQTYSEVSPVPKLIPAGPVPLGHHPPASHAILSVVQLIASATGGCAKHFLLVCVTVLGHHPRE